MTKKETYEIKKNEITKKYFEIENSINTLHNMVNDLTTAETKEGIHHEHKTDFHVIMHRVDLLKKACNFTNDK